MSDKLINEYPLLVLPSLAEKIGLSNAIFLQQVHFWLNHSSNIEDGRKWVYKTYDEWNEEFPFWTYDKVGRIARDLEKRGLLMATDKYNKMSTDRTKWYSINYQAVDNLDLQGRVLEKSTLEDGKSQRSREPQKSTLLPETTAQNTSIDKDDKDSIVIAYEKSFGFLISATIAEELYALVEEYSHDWVVDALREAAEQGIRTLAYVRGILQNWRREGHVVGERRVAKAKNGKRSNIVQEPSEETLGDIERLTGK